MVHKGGVLRNNPMFKLNLAGFIMRDLSSGAVISRLRYLSQTREDVEGNPR